MDVNAILAAMNAEGYNVKDVTADDLRPIWRRSQKRATISLRT